MKQKLMYAVVSLLLGVQKSINSDWSNIARKLGLTTSQHHILLTIYFKPGATLSQLSEYTLWTIPNVMHVVNNLEKKGLVAKYIDRKDTRLRKVHLTERGEELIKQAKDLSEEYEILKLFEQLGEKEVINCLERLYDIVEFLQGPKYVEFIKNNIKKLKDGGNNT